MIKARQLLRDGMADETSAEAMAPARFRLLERLPEEESLACLLRIQEFFDLDGCRDLLLHPCETCFSLPGIRMGSSAGAAAVPGPQAHWGLTTPACRFDD